jgi:hypothetical protein
MVSGAGGRRELGRRGATAGVVMALVGERGAAVARDVVRERAVRERAWPGEALGTGRVQFVAEGKGRSEGRGAGSRRWSKVAGAVMGFRGPGAEAGRVQRAVVGGVAAGK